MRGTMVVLVLLLLAAFAAGPAYAGGEGCEVELCIYGGRVWFDDY